MKLTVNDVAFIIETIANLNSDPAVKHYAGHLLIAAKLVRKATDEQLAEALAEVTRGE